MTKTKIFKGLALINFVCLVTLFLYFRNGSFHNNKNLTSPNGGTPTKILKDTLSQNKDSLQLQRFSSSKSLVIIDNLKLNKDNSKSTKDTIKIQQTEEKKHLMYSSKSGIIIDSKMFKTDSTKIKTKKLKKKSSP